MNGGAGYMGGGGQRHSCKINGWARQSYLGMCVCKHNYIGPTVIRGDGVTFNQGEGGCLSQIKLLAIADSWH